MNGMKKRNTVVAVALFLVVLCLGVGFLDRGHEWGDDFAAYMLEARAIAEGTMEEQISINRKIHASPMSFGEGKASDTLTYVWGYPLMLSAVYSAVGYDCEAGIIPIAYKLPNLIAYALFVLLVFLFYRRRLAFVPAIFLSLIFALHPQMLEYVNLLMSDVFCLTLCVAALLLAEIFFDCNDVKRKTGIGILLGTVLWYNYEVRLNGVSVIVIVVFAHALHLFNNRRKKQKWMRQLSPYLTLLILLGISYCVMPQATSNTNHIASGPNWWIINNLNYYNVIIGEWIRPIIPEFLLVQDYAHYAVYVLIAIGVLYAGISRNLHLTALMMGTMAVVMLLPYTQPIRYLFNALPLMLLFAVYGVQFIWKKAKEKLGRKARVAVRCAGYALMLVCVANMAINTLGQIKRHAEYGAMEYRYGAYGKDAVEIYQYIRDNTEEEAVIAFIKPRAMYLNTGRICYIPGINGNSFQEMDYYVSFGMRDYLIEEMGSDMWNGMTEVYRNDSFVMYKAADTQASLGNGA